MPSGSIRRRRRRWSSLRVASAPNRSGWCSRSATRTNERSSRDFQSWPCTAWTTTKLAFGSAARPGAPTMVDRIEQQFLRQLAALPEPARQLLLVAAADPVGDLLVLWRAAERLGIGLDAATAAESAGLIELQDGIRFRHPLVRSAVYRTATPPERRTVHEALADVTDPALDPDRRTWHLALAAVAPDEEVASALEESAARALALGGLGAAASLVATAAALTPE